MRAARRDAHRPSLAAGASSCTPCGTGSYYSSSGAYALLILVREISLMCDREHCVVRRHVSVGIRLCACACARTRMFTDVLEHALDPESSKGSLCNRPCLVLAVSIAILLQVPCYTVSVPKHKAIVTHFTLSASPQAPSRAPTAPLGPTTPRQVCVFWA